METESFVSKEERRLQILSELNELQSKGVSADYKDAPMRARRIKELENELLEIDPPLR